jgi:hypothetical protein
MYHVYTTGAKISRAGHPIWFFATGCSSNTVPFGGMGHVYVKHLLARRVRTDQRWVEGARLLGGHPGSDAWEGRSLLVDQHVDVELT